MVDYIIGKSIYRIGAAGLIGLFLTGCTGIGSSDPDAGTFTDNETTTVRIDEAADEIDDSDTFFAFGEEFYNSKIYTEDLVEPDNGITAGDIYREIEYVPQMFYGDYRLNHHDDGVPSSYASKKFLDTCEWTAGENITPLFGSKEVSVLPYRIVSGNAELDNALITDTSHNWCQVYYAVKDDFEGVYFDAALDVEGNTVTFTPVKSWSFDEASADLSYEFEEGSISYDFSFAGPRLTLYSDSGSYTLIERDFTDWKTYVSEKTVSVEGNLSENSGAVDDISEIDISVSFDDSNDLNLKKSAFTVKTGKDASQKTCNGIARWDEDGLFTFSYRNEEGKTLSHSMVLFYCGFDGIILSDGKRNYYYLSTFLSTASIGHYSIEDLGMNVSEEDQDLLQNLTDEEIATILETREDLLSDFAESFTSNGIAADIDEDTGEILLDSSILFASNKSSLSADGKRALDAFISAFTSVISNEKYDGFISRVEVQGHTDTDGSYEMNKELSQKRAESVIEYCLSEETSIDAKMRSELESMLVPVGYSYDKPICDADGNVDKAASRRVEFVFYINLSGSQD